MAPPQAGAVLHDVEGVKLSRIPFLLFLAFIFCGPIYFLPQFWFIGVGAFVAFAALYWFGTNWSAAQLRVDSVCENGIVTTERGVDTVIPWQEVQTVTFWTHRTTTGYDINTRERRYRLGQGLGKAKLKAIIDTVVGKAPLEWIHDTIATRPENAPKAREELAKILATIGR